MQEKIMAINFSFKEDADTGMELNFFGGIDGTENIGEDGTVLSFKERPSSSFDISFILKITKDVLRNALPDGDIDTKSFEDSIEMNLFYESIASRKRGLIKLSKNSSSSDKDFLFFSSKMTIDHQLWFGEINFKGIALRTVACSEAAGFNTDKHTIIGSSAEKRLYIDPFTASSGGQLDVKIGEVDDYNGVLYKLDKTNLVVLLNNKAPLPVQQILSCEYKSGVKAALRDALFEPIVIDITEQLAREAFEMMLSNIEDSHVKSPLELNEPFKSVACDIAKELYKDLASDEEKNQSLVENLRDRDSRLKIINNDLPMVVQSLSKVQKHYDTITQIISENKEKSND